MTSNVVDFEVLSHVAPNGTLRKYGCLEFQRQGCQYRAIVPIAHEDSSAEQETYQALISKLDKCQTQPIPSQSHLTSEEAFQMIFKIAQDREQQS
ncbi:hypothetical protein [Roseofilum casamattae]|uniref:Uncharacterized protein n=1 Tax=Roseofilum casamattae BLCC-M143 TaxID=3022442 RepID=A0ABT7C031_9CYAN|nr:hypothetical protein [Roseofilum casamattae]MDJ1184797.1 hypothetical protein [Roseofilum casamattae BLCC-M143]